MTGNDSSSDARGRVLFICPHLPHPNASQAGQRVAWNNLVRLAQESTVDVLLVVNAWELEAGVPAWPVGVSNVQILTVSPLRKALSVVLQFGRLTPKLATRCNWRSAAVLDQMIRTHHYAHVWLEFTEVGGFVPRLPQDIPFTLSVHDVLVQWAIRRGGWLSVFLPGLYRDEQRLMCSAAEIRCLSMKDADLLRSLYSVEKVTVMAPELGAFVTRVVRNPTGVDTDHLLFWGAMNRRENILAVEQFLDQHWPVIRGRRPSARLTVVGSNPPPWLLAIDGKNGVHVTGFVDDPAPFFSRATLGIAPLSEGAGIKLKVLEMLACGIPVVTTEVGAEGIACQPELHVVKQADFSDKVLDLLGNPVPQVSRALSQ